MTKLFAPKSTANPPTQTDTFTLILIILSTRNSQLPRHYMTELTHTTPSQQMHDTKPPMFCLFYNSTVSLSGTPTPSPRSNNGTQLGILCTSPPYCKMYRQRWARATSKVAPLPLPLLPLKSSVATATRYSSSKVARYRYFTSKVAGLPATLNNV